MAQAEQAHRFEIERAVVGSETGAVKRAQWMALGVVVATMLTTSFAVWREYPWVAAVLAAIPIGQIVNSFLMYRAEKADEAQKGKASK